MAEIRLDKVAHSYDGGKTFALQETSVVWDDGKAYALLGPSGCGKTTLLNIVSGLIIPSHGRIFIDGVDVTQTPTEGRNIAQVFQFPVLYDTMTVRRNLEFPLKNRKVNPEQIAIKVDKIAELLELTDSLDVRPGKLRSDLQQIVSLGRALVREDVAAILFDEPLTVIDQNFKWTLRSRLKKLHLRTGATIVYVTHDQTEALTFADEVLVMKDGQLVQSGSSEELYLYPKHEFVGFFIGSPGMNFLNAEVSGSSVSIDGNAVGIAKGKIQDGSYRLGVGPEFLVPSPAGLEFTVDRIENRGVYQLAHLRINDQKLIAKLDSDHSINKGDQVKFALDLNKSFLFHEKRMITNLSPVEKGSK